MNYEISSQKIKNYEATFMVYLEGDEKLYEILASFSPYANEDEAYAEDVEFSVYLGKEEVKLDQEGQYKELFEKLDTEIQDHVQENGYEIWQDRMQGAADAAYDAWKDRQMEGDE